MAKARRGDLVAVVIEHTSYTINPSTTRKHTDVSLRTVSSITREGAIKATRDHGGSVLQRDREAYSHPQYLLIDQTSVDVLGAMAGFEARLWRPEEEIGYRHGGKPFESVDECRDFVRGYMVAKVG